METADTNQERHEILKTVRRLADEFAITYPIRDRQREFPHQEIEQLKACGLLAISVPRQYGGLGLPFRDIVESVLTLAEGNPSVAQVFLVHCVGSLFVCDFVTQAQRQALFQQVIENRAYLGNALSERQSKSKYELDTRFSRTPDNTGILINGKKFFSTGSLASDVMMVIGMLDTSMAIAFVPRQAPGLQVRDDWTAMGQRGTASGTTEFHDVFVGWDMIVPSVGEGGKIRQDNLVGPMTQICFASIFVGTAKGALKQAVEYVQTKTRPWVLGGVEAAVEDPYILQETGMLRASVSAAESLVYRAVDLIEDALAARESENQEELLRRRGEAAVAVAEAKVFCTNVALHVCQEIFRLCGARATLEEENFDRFWRDVRTLTLHDPVDYKARLIGEYLLQNKPPTATFIS